MTREEQIKQQADIYTDDASNYAEWSDDGGWSKTNDIELIKKAFIKAANWADENPKKGLISIDKVCELLKKHINIHGFENTKIEWIKQFRKVMEE